MNGKDWIDKMDEKQVYWLSGEAGTGKTTVALTTTDDVMKDGNKSSASFVCSCDDKDQFDGVDSKGTYLCL